MAYYLNATPIMHTAACVWHRRCKDRIIKIIVGGSQESNRALFLIISRAGVKEL
jgi:hypothetical protein